MNNPDMKILILDNYDSFTYNLVHAVRKLGYRDIEVHRNDRISAKEVKRFDKIILSPGPGIPSEAGILLELIQTYAPTKSILGVCLGAQAIAEAFGGSLINLPEVYHGVATKINVIGDDILFYDMLSSISVGRYHSWAIDDKKIPDCLRITAIDKKGIIMAIAHKQYDVHGVQFHPESVLTPEGELMLKNWLNHRI